MQQEQLRNIFFITTDVHFAGVFRYTPVANDPSFKIYEFVTGPLNAGLFPNHNFDTTLNIESLFFYGPDTNPTNYVQAKHWMNFGVAQINENGELTISIRDTEGVVVYQTNLQPQ